MQRLLEKTFSLSMGFHFSAGREQSSGHELQGGSGLWEAAEKGGFGRGTPG